MRRLVLLLPIVTLALPAAAQTPPPSAPPPSARPTVSGDGRVLSVTVTTGGLAMVGDSRRVTLPAGPSHLLFGGLSRHLIGGTAQLSGDKVTVESLSFAAEPITPFSLLNRAVGQEVTWMRRPSAPDGAETPVRARLLSAQGPVLEIDGHIEVAPPGRIVYDRLPAGAGDASTLSAAVTSAAAGHRELALTYLTSGLSWRAEYQLWLDGDPNADQSPASLTGWAVVTNQTGTDFPEARLTLLAGELNRAPQPAGGAQRAMATVAMAPAPVAPAMAPTPPAQSLAGSYLYSPAPAVSLGDGQTRELPLIDAPHLPAHRELVAQALPEFLVSRPVSPDELRNPEQTRPLSMLVIEAKGPAAVALPPGVVRVFSHGAGGQLRYLGEDSVAQKAKGETWRLTLGRDSEVSVQRLQTAFIPPHPQDPSWESAWQVHLFNHKDHDVVVRVEERLPVDGTVLQESQPHESPDARSLVWPVKVPAGGDATLTYRLRRNG